MAFDGNIVIGTSVDVGGINTGLNKISNQFRKLQRATSGGIFGNLISEAVGAASDLREVQNVVDVTFEDMSYKAEKFADIAVDTFGMSKLAAKQTAGSFMAMGTAMDLDAENASNMAINLAALTGDFASFFNISQEYARVALSAVYTGETETLKRYGIILTEANLQQYALSQGITKSVKAMGAQEKLLLRYNYIIDHTDFILGDFVRTQDSWANQTKLMKQNWTNFLIVVGNGLTTVLAPMLTVINALIQQMERFAKLILVIMHNIFGINFDVAADDMSNLADSDKEAAKAEEDLADAITAKGKAAKKALSPLDELNILSENAATGKGTDKTDVFGDFNIPDPTAAWMDSIEDAITSDIDNLFDFGKMLADRIIETLNKIDWSKVYATSRKIFFDLAQFLNGFISPELFGNVSKTLASALNTAVYGALKFFQTFDFKDLGESIAEAINTFFSTFDFMAFATSINKFVDGIRTALKATFENIKWDEVMDSLKTFFSTLDLDVYIAIGCALLLNALNVILFKPLKSYVREYITHGIFKAILSQITTSFPIFLSNVINFLQTLTLTSLPAFFTSIVNFILASIVAIGPKIIVALINLYNSLFGSLSLSIQTVAGQTLEQALVQALQGMTLKEGAAAVLKAIGSLLKEIVVKLLPEILPTLTAIGGAISFVFGLLSSLVGTIWMVIDGFSWLKEVLIVIGGVLVTVGLLILGCTAWPAIIIGAVIAAVGTITGLVGHFIVENWDKIKEFFANVWEGLKSLFVSAIQAVMEFGVKLKDAFLVLISNALNTFVSLSTKFYSKFVKPIVEFITPVVEYVWHLFEGVLIIIEALYIVTRDFIITKFTEGIEKITRGLEGLKIYFSLVFEFIRKYISEKWEQVKKYTIAVTTLIQTGFEVALSYVQGKFEMFKIQISRLINEIKIFIGEKLDAIKEKVDDIISKIKSAIGELISKIASDVKAFVDEKIKPKIELIQSLAESCINAIKDFMKPFVDDFMTYIGDPLIEKVMTITTKAKELFSELWQDIIKGGTALGNGIISLAESAINGIIDVFNNFIGGFNGLVKTAANITGKHWDDAALLNKVTLTRLNVPKLATGAVIPPNSPFLAMLGDQRNGTNIEAPLSTIQDAVASILEPYLRQISNDVKELAGKDYATYIGDRDIAKANNRGQRLLGATVVS